MPYQAGDNAGPLNMVCTISVPALPWVQGAILGTMQTFTYASAWLDSQDFTASQAAALFQQIYDSIQFGVVTVGQILCFTQDNMEYIGRNPSFGASNLLPCDGRSLNTSDYPTLFSLIGYTFGGSGATFDLPDIRGRTVIGVGQGPGLTNRPLGDSLGEENHQLQVLELASHEHIYTGAITTPILQGEVPGLSVSVPTPEYTNLVGGDEAHNTMQPSLALYYYIQVV